jgi:hypothetical protein
MANLTFSLYPLDVIWSSQPDAENSSAARDASSEIAEAVFTHAYVLIHSHGFLTAPEREWNYKSFHTRNWLGMLCTFSTRNEDNIALARVRIAIFQEEDLIDTIVL